MKSVGLVVEKHWRFPLVACVLLLCGAAFAGGCSGSVEAISPSGIEAHELDALSDPETTPPGDIADREWSPGPTEDVAVCDDPSDETPAAGAPDTEASAQSVPATASPSRSGVDLVYFHTAQACGCMAEMGDVIKTAVHESFPEAINDNTVRFHSIISDDPANAYFVRMYGSQQFDLFIVTYDGGKAMATQVPEIWSLIGDNEAVATAVTARIADVLARSAQPS